MVEFSLVGVLLIALVGDPPSTSQDARTYQALKAKAGQDSQAQVKLALWCEAHGLDSERVKHLARAVLSDPKNMTARGLLGLVAFGGRWESAEKIGERIKADEQRTAKLAEYEGRRVTLNEKEGAIRKAEERHKASGRPDLAYAARLKGNHELAREHAKIGLWCEENGLQAEALAHFTTSVHLDPYREASWRHLGCVKRKSRWMTAEQAAADEHDEHDQRVANRHWEPLLTKWKTWLSGPSSSPSRRAEARERLATMTDPRAVPPILKVFSVDGLETEQAFLVQLLGQIDDPRSSLALADLAVRSRWESVRWAASAVLKKRPRRDYAGHLVEIIHAKIRSKVLKPVGGPGSMGALELTTPRVRMIRTYEAPPVFRLSPSFQGYIGYDVNGLPVVMKGYDVESLARAQDPYTFAERIRRVEESTLEMMIEANIKSRIAQQRMAEDLAEVEQINGQTEADNARVNSVLQLTADAPADLKGDDEEGFNAWWFDKLGYSYQSPPQVTIVQNATPQLIPAVIGTCFAAGTPVRTLDGLRPIEAIQVGDQVLSQDAVTGALSFQSVVFLHHNPPAAKTLRLSFANGDSLVCSVYHRFWRANQGWAMARELKPGDTLRTFGGLAKLAKLETETIQPLYNLDVAGPRTFFVGRSSILVHDNTLPDHRLKPFDALPVVEVRVDAGLHPVEE